MRPRLYLGFWSSRSDESFRATPRVWLGGGFRSRDDAEFDELVDGDLVPALDDEFEQALNGAKNGLVVLVLDEGGGVFAKFLVNIAERLGED